MAACCHQSSDLRYRWVDIQGNNTAEGGLVKQSKQVGKGCSSSEVAGSDGLVTGGEEQDAESESDADSSSGTVTRPLAVVVVRDRRARSSSRPIELRSSVVSDSAIPT
jgi:hypothetical protein